MLGVQCLVSAFNNPPLNEHIVRFSDVSHKYDFIYLFFFHLPMFKGK